MLCDQGKKVQRKTKQGHGQSPCHLHVEQPLQPLLVQLQLLLPPPGIELLQPPQLLLPPLLPLLSGQRVAQELAGEWELHLVDMVLIVIRTPPFLKFFKEMILEVRK